MDRVSWLVFVQECAFNRVERQQTSANDITAQLRLHAHNRPMERNVNVDFNYL